MRSSTKISNLVKRNRVVMESTDDGRIEVMVTNSVTGDSFISYGRTLSAALSQAMKDEVKMKRALMKN